jgi:hypothetical protein
MKKCSKFGFTAIIAGFFASGCAHTQMTKQSVTQIANHEADQSRDMGLTHRSLSDYHEPKVSFHHGIWTVSYYPVIASQAQYQLPGGTPPFSILVDDQTAQVVRYQ